MDRFQINHETLALNDTLDKMDLIDIHRKFQPKGEYTFFSRSYGTFSRIDMLDQKTSLNEFKTTEIVSRIFSDQNGMKLEINRKKTERITNMWRLNNMLLNNQ